MKYALLFIVLLAGCLCSPTRVNAVCQLFNPPPPDGDGGCKDICGNWGTELRRYKNVPAYSNGGWNGSGCYSGGSVYGYYYQCVEYVKRFYGQEVGDPINTSWREAKNAFVYKDKDDRDPSPNLVAFPQGGSTKPQPGDILCFGPAPGKTNSGHVGIIMEVGSNYVKMIDQNRTTSSTNNPIQLSLSMQPPYSVGTIGSSYVVQGWLRDPDYSLAPLFADVIQRNGGQTTVGTASGGIYTYGPYKRQDFTGGSFVNCCIMYDPNNVEGNPQATNEAYLLRTGFYEAYKYHPETHEFKATGWVDAYGCPSRDEYATGAPGDAIQFFVRRVDGKTQFHYMYYQANLPQGQRVSWHSSYTTEFVAQLPPQSFTMARSETREFTVQFRNTGTTTWYNNLTAYPYDYVTLKSCDANGAVGASFLNTPTDESLGWLASDTPCTMEEASVAPGEVATFTFTGKVASNASFGLHDVYFRPAHATAGLLDGWGEMHYPISAISATTFEGLTLTPFVGDWNNDGHDEVGVYVDESCSYFLDTNNDSFTDLELAYSAWVDEPLAGDWDGDGDATVGLYRPAYRVFYLDYTNDGAMDVGLAFGDAGDIPICGDWDGNGTATIGVYRPSTRTFWLDYNNDGYADLARTLGDGGDLPIVGDWDGNGTWTVGVYRPSTRTFWLCNDNAGPPVFSRAFGNVGDVPVCGDWDGDGAMTIGVFRPSTQVFWLDYNNDGIADRSYRLQKKVQTAPQSIRESIEAVPSPHLMLAQNFPNPFVGMTTIRYSLPAITNVRLEVFNLLGQRLAILAQGQQEAGAHQVDWDASSFASGIYFLRLTVGEAAQTRKMFLRK